MYLSVFIYFWCFTEPASNWSHWKKTAAGQNHLNTCSPVHLPTIKVLFDRNDLFSFLTLKLLLNILNDILSGWRHEKRKRKRLVSVKCLCRTGSHFMYTENKVSNIKERIFTWDLMFLMRTDALNSINIEGIKLVTTKYKKKHLYFHVQHRRQSLNNDEKLRKGFNQIFNESSLTKLLKLKCALYI